MHWKVRFQVNFSNKEGLFISIVRKFSLNCKTDDCLDLHTVESLSCTVHGFKFSTEKIAKFCCISV
jgi:hypothetical protein